MIVKTKLYVIFHVEKHIQLCTDPEQILISPRKLFIM